MSRFLQKFRVPIEVELFLISKGLETIFQVVVFHDLIYMILIYDLDISRQKYMILINLSFIQSWNINLNNVLKLRTFYFELELLKVTSTRKQ